MTNITKNNLNKAMEFISELNFDDDDYEKIFNKFKLILQNPETIEIFKKISKIQDITKETADLNLIVKNLSDSVNLDDLNSVLSKLTKNEELINFIQDLFLEKLL